jgi:hypothetical protein
VTTSDASGRRWTAGSQCSPDVVKALLKSRASPSTPSGGFKSMPQHAVVQCFDEFMVQQGAARPELLARLEEILGLLQQFHCTFQSKNNAGCSAYDELMQLHVPASNAQLLEARKKLEAILRPFEPSFQVRADRAYASQDCVPKRKSRPVCDAGASSAVTRAHAEECTNESSEIMIAFTQLPPQRTR